MLAGSELGAVEVGPGPALGESRVVRRSEVLAAIRRTGRDPSGLAVPARTRVHREGNTLSAAELSALALDEVRSALAPCDVERLELPSGAVVGEGPLEVAVAASPRRATGSTTTSVRLRVRWDDGSTELASRVHLRCPPPLVQPGARVRLVVRIGAVEASTPGIVHEAGREGEIVRVRNASTRAMLRARVLEADLLEVVE